MTELQNPSDQSIEEFVSRRETFIVHATGGDLMEYCSRIEFIIEAAHMSCRVRTRNRTAASVGSLLTGVGVLGLAAQLTHNVVTFNPDWEIIRNPINNKIKVDYCPGVFS